MKPSLNKNGAIPCSVGILTYNSGATLRKCLESVKQFSEIIVCDGGSEDDTLKIANDYGCVVVKQDSRFKYSNNKISNFAGVRNQTLKRATHNWFLFVDSDEYLSPEVVSEIGSIVDTKENNKKKVYQMPRKFSLNDSVIDCASSYPAYQMRFFDKKYTNHFIKSVHERIKLKENVTVGQLSHPVIVPIETDESVIKKKSRYYLQIELKRNSDLSCPQLLKAIVINVRAIFGRMYRYIKNIFICRGTRLPLRRECMALRYTVDVVVVLVRILLKKLYGRMGDFFQRKV